VGNLQRKVRAAGKRREAVALCLRGVSDEKIAEQLSVSTTTVRKYLTTFLQTDCKFPVGVGADQIQLMRCEQREHLEGWQRRLLNRAEKLAAIATYGPEEAVAFASATAKLSDSFCRVSDRIASLFGLDAAKPEPISVTNNALIMVGSAEASILKMLGQNIPNNDIQRLGNAPVQDSEEIPAPVQEIRTGRPEVSSMVRDGTSESV
jgi:hypothetical protein